MRLWRARPEPDPDRWVVLDVESSGLDPRRDRLLAIAAVALQVRWAERRLSIDLGDSFEVVLRQGEPSARDNILLHGIGVQRQKEGVPPAEALAAFAVFAGDSPLLAFHAAFDRVLIARHMALPNRWLDIEHLCGVTHPQVRARSLDEWMSHFGVRCAARHRAAADVLAESEVLLRVWPKVAAECTRWREVERLAARHRWIGRA
jgi:DNA polymerase III subunit epsilon